MGEENKREDEEGGREGNTGGETRQERDIICVTTNFREATDGPEREAEEKTRGNSQREKKRKRKGGRTHR